MAFDALLEKSIETDEGYAVLSAVRDIYNGKAQHQEDLSPAIMDGLLQEGVIRRNNSRIELTSQGYTFGNISKEYCNWVDNARHMPQPKPPTEFYKDKIVLDLGCSIGRWIWEFKEAKELIGIELEKEYVDAARILSKKETDRPATIINASIEDLNEHVNSGSVELVFCRLVFNHLYVKSTLKKIFEALADGGIFWLQVENYRLPIQTLTENRRLRSKLRAMFAFFNTLVFMAFGKQLCLKTKGRMHTHHKPVFPSGNTWARCLRSTGFRDVELRYEPTGYVLVARKIASAERSGTDTKLRSLRDILRKQPHPSVPRHRFCTIQRVRKELTAPRRECPWGARHASPGIACSFQEAISSVLA